MDAETRKRYRCIELYGRSKSFSIVAHKYGISRVTLRNWVRRYERDGIAGLVSESPQPKRSPARKISTYERGWILELRSRRLGSRRIQSELRRTHSFHVSRTTIDKVLTAAKAEPLANSRLHRKRTLRYAKGSQASGCRWTTWEIGPGLYQYTATDDCTRIRILALYSRGTR